MHVIDQQIAYNGHYKLSQLRVQDGENVLKRERFEPGTAVAALVRHTGSGHYLLARQYRIGPEKELVELAAGMVDEGEEPATAIRREIQEELGYEVDYLEQIARIFPSPGNSAETITVFYAEVSRQPGPGGGLASENERIEEVKFSADELFAARFEDAKTLIAVQWAQLRK